MLNAELKSMNSILTYESFVSRCVRAGWRAVAMASSVERLDLYANWKGTGSDHEERSESEDDEIEVVKRDSPDKYTVIVRFNEKSQSDMKKMKQPIYVDNSPGK